MASTCAARCGRVRRPLTYRLSSYRPKRPETTSRPACRPERTSTWSNRSSRTASWRPSTRSWLAAGPTERRSSAPRPGRQARGAPLPRAVGLRGAVSLRAVRLGGAVGLRGDRRHRWQREPEDAAATRAALDPDLATVQLHDPLADRQAETEAADLLNARLLAALERLEQGLDLL